METNVGLNELANNSFEIYPNPSTGFVKIKGLDGNLSIYSATGSLVKTQVVKENTVIDLSSFGKRNLHFKTSKMKGQWLLKN